MIITKLYGGLGNQMFQYAAGCVLAKKLQANHVMDLSWFDEIKDDPGVTQRVYELDGWGIPIKEASLFGKLNIILNHPTIFKEDSLEYNKQFNKLSGNVILDGYWQSYRYFDGYEDFVHNLFRSPSLISPANERLLKRISSTDSISLHIRRGDYNTSTGKTYHGLMSLDYYKKSLSKITDQVKEPVVFIFSDEIDWCKSNIKLGQPTVFIDSNGPSSGVEDMRLMSACRHNIIANSSFSWWAAWLNLNDGKIVCAPRNWFAGEKHQINDRIPPEWQLL
jgi:hypothetical protein